MTISWGGPNSVFSAGPTLNLTESSWPRVWPKESRREAGTVTV